MVPVITKSAELSKRFSISSVYRYLLDRISTLEKEIAVEVKCISTTAGVPTS